MTRRPSLRTSELRTPRDASSPFVFAVVFASAATQFAIQAWMTFRFAADVWDIPQPLCVALIVALDLFAVTFMVFTYLLREAKWPTKAYVWTIFAVGVGAQVLAAELYGDHKDWATEVRIFAGLPSLFLAASLHGLILWRRHRTDGPPPAKRSHPDFIRCPLCNGDAISRGVLRSHMARRHPAPTPPAPNQAPKTARPARPDRVPELPPVASGAAPKKTRRGGRKDGPSREVKRDAVQQVLDGKAMPGDLAPALGVSKRAVEIWVQHARAATAGQQFSNALTSTLPASPQVNGHRPEVGVTP